MHAALTILEIYSPFPYLAYVNFQLNPSCRKHHFSHLHIDNIVSYKDRTCTSVLLKVYRFLGCTCHV